MGARKIFIIAGEASGDLHGANLIRNLRARSSEPLEIFGVGGEKIRLTGAKEFLDIARFHVTGLTDALRAVPKYREAEKRILESVRRIRPDLVVLIDNPGFNLLLAKKIHSDGIRIVYFIAPQVWAWAPQRVLTMKKFVDKVLVVFRFEKEFFEKHGVPVAWVGHPLKDLVERPEKKIRPYGPVIALLPGSRKGELKMILPELLKAAELISRQIPSAAFTLLQSHTISTDIYRKQMLKSRLPVNLVQGSVQENVGSSDLALVCSGTATLECALLGVPMVITYKGSLVTYLAARKLIRVPFIGLPNLILEERRFPELLQYKATPERIANEALKILRDDGIRNQMQRDCEEVSRRIGEKGASARAADEILNLLDNQ